MDRDEPEVLEDWFRHPGGGGLYVPNLNGHLHGRPKFVIDGERRGFVFDGKTQYAEASPTLADLGRITVDIALKSGGGGAQTIFDFGSSPNNCFVLKTARNGKPEFAAKVSGKTVVTLTGRKAISPNEWVSLRVEIDGKKIAIWIDGKKVAEKASSFRPADVYPAGVEKRNFIAATREATGHFKGSIDYLRVYYTVYEDFTKAPSPRRHASRKITKEFIDTCSKLYEGTGERREKLIREKVKPKLVYYDQLVKRRGELLKEIEAGSSKATAEENRKLGELKKKLDKRTGELRAEFDKLPQTIKQRKESQQLEEKARELDKQRSEAIKAIETRYRTENKPAFEAEAKRRKAGIKLPKGEKTPRQKMHELIQKNPKIIALRLDIDKCRKQARKLRPDPRNYTEERTVALRQQVTKADIAAREAHKRYLAKYKLEHDWLSSLGWLVSSGHYNYPYRRYFHKQISKTIGGKVCHENFGSLGSLMGAQEKSKWHTKCDWDWRLKQEIDGSITNLPMLRKWIERARGKVETRKTGNP
ncbi:MAG: hypothetical protein QGH60_13930 [Phycisphaerae bacterium]|nr:hypothetical protein [Phycisphaerae bacterium]